MTIATEPALAFDALAPRYANLVETNPIHAYLRRRSLEWLDEAFHPGMHVLEIGCGTGTEAVHLARRGVAVTATDVSSPMVREAAERARRHGVLAFLRFETCAARDLPGRFKGEAFDGAYSSFGALNCEPSLTGSIAGIATLLKPGAAFIASLASRPSIWEIGTGVVSLRWRKAFRRLCDDGARIDVHGHGAVQSRAYSETELVRALGTRFTVERLDGLLVTIPPPHLVKQWVWLRDFHTSAELLDRRLGHVGLLRGLGDHIHLWARRTER